MIACIKIGIVTVPLDPMLQQSQLENIFQNLKPKLVLSVGGAPHYPKSFPFVNLQNVSLDDKIPLDLANELHETLTFDNESNVTHT